MIEADYTRVEHGVEEIRVSGRTNVQDLGLAIVQTHAAKKRVVLVSIGMQAINQANKAVVVANSRNISHGIVHVMLPTMEDIYLQDDGTGDKVQRTAMKHILLPYQW